MYIIVAVPGRTNATMIVINEWKVLPRRSHNFIIVALLKCVTCRHKNQFRSQSLATGEITCLQRPRAA